MSLAELQVDAHRRPTRPVLTLVLISWVSLGIQLSLADIGEAPSGAGAWLAIGTVLLAFVLVFRSKVARGFLIISASWGGVIWGTGAFTDTRHAVIALAFFGQALPLLMTPVRDHVQAEQ